MRLRYVGTCRECGADLPAGASATFDRSTKTVICIGCLSPGSEAGADPADEVAFVAGIAGASARRKFEQLKTKRETRIRTAHPHLGGLMLALSDEPQSTTAWAKGARGEVLLGKRVDALVARGVQVLHDRRIPGTQANIDHIVVGPRGVFVIDAKRYTGGPRLQVHGGLFSPRTEKLMVGSRDCTGLVGGVKKQMRLVDGALLAARIGDIPIFGMLCFVEADWPLLGGEFRIDGLDVLWPSKAVSRVTESGALDAGGRDAVARALAAHFPQA